MIAFAVPRCDGSEVFEFTEEAFDKVVMAIEERAEGRDGYTTGQGNGRSLGDNAILEIV